MKPQEEPLEDEPSPKGASPHPFYPRYFKDEFTVDQRRFYKKDRSLLSQLKNIQVHIVSNLNEARELWQEFSPGKSLFDTWEFRQAFYDSYQFEPYFLTLKQNGDTLGVLPLWYETDKERYYWFGSWWQEDNTFFVRDPIFIPLLLAAAPKPLLLNAISAQSISWPSEVVAFAEDDPKFILDLTGMKSPDDFLALQKKKKRYNMKRDFRHIESQNPKVIYNRFSDFAMLVNLSKERFEDKGENTDWEDSRRVGAFENVIKLGLAKKSYDIRMITVEIGGEIASVDLIAIYNGCYYPVKCGYNVKKFSGIGNYVNLFEIQDALSLKAQKMDFLEIAYGWKDKWFTPSPLLKFEK